VFRLLGLLSFFGLLGRVLTICQSWLLRSR